MIQKHYLCLPYFKSLTSFCYVYTDAVDITRKKSPQHSLDKIYLPFSVVGRAAASKNSYKLQVRMILVHNANENIPHSSN